MNLDIMSCIIYLPLIFTYTIKSELIPINHNIIFNDHFSNSHYSLSVFEGPSESEVQFNMLNRVYIQLWSQIAVFTRIDTEWDVDCYLVIEE